MHISPKVIASTVAALLVPGLLAVVAYLQSPDGAKLFSGVPPLVAIAIAAILPALATFLAGYMKTDPARTGGTGALPPTEPADDAPPEVDPPEPDETDDGELPEEDEPEDLEPPDGFDDGTGTERKLPA